MRRHVLWVAAWLLPFILAVLFFIKGRHYDPAFFEPPAAEFSALPVPSAMGEWVLEGAQTLPAERMFEKINGKADYYLQYGAVELCSGEWVANGQSEGSDSAGAERWDMYLYRFKEEQGARGAYIGERPADGRAIEGAEGYTVPGQAVIAAGTFYLQLNAQAAAADASAAIDLALALAPILSGSASEMQSEAVLDLVALAGDSLVGDSEGFLPESAFGFSALNKVRTVQVSLNGSEAIWFTASGNAETVAAYAEELAMYGGENLFSQNGGSGGSMFNSWEFAGILNGMVWGIHDAPSREALLQHWDLLKEKLQTLPEAP